MSFGGDAERGGQPSLHAVPLDSGSLPFLLRSPTAPETPVIVEVPHAGLSVDAGSMRHLVAPIRSIARDADFEVHRVFEVAPACGATLLVATHSRFVVDLNRARDDYDGLTVDGGPERMQPRGVVWRLTTDGEPMLSRRLDRAELERRLESFYDPYHAKLAELVEAKKRAFGVAVVVAGHSMPSSGRRGHVDVSSGRADVVPGTRGHSTAAPDLIDSIDIVAARHGLSVAHDTPYRGGHNTQRWGRPTEGVHALQVELARRLYLDGEELAVVPGGLSSAQRFIAELLTELGRWRPAVAP
jgi:N-formylglutamate deformylase